MVWDTGRKPYPTSPMNEQIELCFGIFPREALAEWMASVAMRAFPYGSVIAYGAQPYP